MPLTSRGAEGSRRSGRARPGARRRARRISASATRPGRTLQVLYGLVVDADDRILGWRPPRDAGESGSTKAMTTRTGAGDRPPPASSTSRTRSRVAPRELGLRREGHRAHRDGNAHARRPTQDAQDDSAVDGLSANRPLELANVPDRLGIDPDDHIAALQPCRLRRPAFQDVGDLDPNACRRAKKPTPGGLPVPR